MRVGIHGFLGASNLGDLAMAVALIDWLRAHGHTPVIFSHDHHPVELERYAAARVEVRDYRDRHAAQHLGALIIGGGALGPGFGWTLLPHVLLGGGRVIAFGQSYGRDWLAPALRDLSRAILQAHHLIIPRDAPSCAVLAELGVQTELGTDPALLLDCPVLPRQDLAMLFVRHAERGNDAEQVALARQAVETLQALGLKVAASFCCEPDRDFWRTQVQAPVTSEWLFYCPHDCLRRLATARLCVTLRRLHPLILAARAGTPCVAVPAHRGDRIEAMAADMGAVLATSPEELRATLQAPPAPRPETLTRLQARLQTALLRLEAVLTA